MSMHDTWLARGRRYPVHVTCECDNEWEDTYEEEYGAGWLVTHEECPKCGASGDRLSIGESEPPEPEYEPEHGHD